MRQAEMQTFLESEEEAGRHVFNFDALGEAFPRESRHTLNSSLIRMVKAGLLHRAARGIYFNDCPRERDLWLVERIAAAMRPGHYTYISLVVALSEWGVISQVPYSLTMVTTGRSGRYNVPLYRTTRPPTWNPSLKRNSCALRFVHTSQSPEKIMATRMPGYHLLPFAEPEQALADYRRCHRPGSHFPEQLDMEIYAEVVAERQEYRNSLIADCVARHGHSH